MAALLDRRRILSKANEVPVVIHDVRNEDFLVATNVEVTNPRVRERNDVDSRQRSSMLREQFYADARDESLQHALV